MKKLVLIAALAMLAGCTSVEKNKDTRNNIKIYDVNETKVGNYDVKLENNKVITKDFEITTRFEDKSILVDVKNISDELLFVQWSKAEYIGKDGKTQRLFDMNQKSRGFFTKAIDFGLRPTKEVNGKLVPVENLEVLRGSSISTEEIFIDKDLFTEEPKIQKYATAIIPISLNGNSGPVVNIEIYFGDGETPKIVKAKKVAPAPVVVPKTRELEGIILENKNLDNELKVKEKILEELRKKEVMQRELAKKEAEIQELMKKLNN